MSTGRQSCWSFSPSIALIDIAATNFNSAGSPVSGLMTAFTQNINQPWKRSRMLTNFLAKCGSKHARDWCASCNSFQQCCSRSRGVLQISFCLLRLKRTTDASTNGEAGRQAHEVVAADQHRQTEHVLVLCRNECSLRAPSRPPRERSLLLKLKLQ